MKIRWRQHGLMLFTILFALTITQYLVDWYHAADQPALMAVMQEKFNRPFGYVKNVLLPQIYSLFAGYITYLLINKAVLPYARKIFSSQNKVSVLIKAAWIFLLLMAISYFLAISVNIASYYARPYLFNYAHFEFLAIFGYNDQPLTNLWAGFGNAAPLTAFYSAFVIARELCIYLLEKNTVGRAYRILVVNKITAAAAVYIGLPFFVTIFLKLFSITVYSSINDLGASLYIAIIPSVFLVFMSNTYWLFPNKGSRSFLDLQVAAPLLFSTLLITFPFLFVLSHLQQHGLENFFLYWALQLFVVTPVSWVVFQLRKDKILQLRNAEKALANSEADLTFLRSQINPHFLFNALNTLYGIALQDGSERAADGIQKLGDMMRFMLDENHRDFISMGKEVAYLQNFIALQKLRTRLSSNIIIEANVGQEQSHLAIAPMLLVPLVENAFKHGISLKEKSWIKIDLKYSATSIHFAVSNSLHENLDATRKKDTQGIGLQNIKRRLALIYPGKHSFTAGAKGKTFVAEIIIHP